MRRQLDLKQRLRVYLVTDERSNTDHLLHVIELALEGGVGTVQLRRKREDGRTLVELGRRIRTLTHQYDALYIVNDRIDVALLTDADGVHVGQSDIACADVQRLVGDRLVGVSASTVEEAQTAMADGADYLGVGALFPTASKLDADLCGIGGLRDIARAMHGSGVASKVPIVAIGGITHENARDVLSAGADGLAVVSAIMQAPDPTDAGRALLAVCQSHFTKLDGTPSGETADRETGLSD